MKKKFLASTALMAGLLFAGGAQAYVVTDNPDSLPPGGVYALDCGGLCQGFTGVNTLSATQARAYDVKPSNETAELAQLNYLLNDGVTYVNKPSPEITGPTASTVREYFSIKIGNQTTFYKNLSGGSLTFTFLKQGKTGGWSPQGYSHLTEYGNEVPLPGAVWLFGSALVGLVAMNRRRRLAA